jgi:hypothetical protein
LLSIFSCFYFVRQEKMGIIDGPITRGDQMRQCFIAAGLLLTALLPSNPARSESYAVWGAGSRSCGSWTSDRKEQGWSAIADLSWVDGFITAMNYSSPRVNGASHKIDGDAIAAWIDNYCSMHPLEPISSAAEALTATLAKR